MDLAAEFQEGDLVALTSPEGAFYKALKGQQKGVWDFVTDGTENEAVDRAHLPAEATLCFMRSPDGQCVGFRSAYADGKVLQATKDKKLTLRFSNHNFQEWEQWFIKGNTIDTCNLVNRKFPDKFFQVTIHKALPVKRESLSIGSSGAHAEKEAFEVKAKELASEKTTKQLEYLAETEAAAKVEAGKLQNKVTQAEAKAKQTDASSAKAAELEEQAGRVKDLEAKLKEAETKNKKLEGKAALIEALEKKLKDVENVAKEKQELQTKLKEVETKAKASEETAAKKEKGLKEVESRAAELEAKLKASEEKDVKIKQLEAKGKIADGVIAKLKEDGANLKRATDKLTEVEARLQGAEARASMAESKAEELEEVAKKAKDAEKLSLKLKEEVERAKAAETKLAELKGIENKVRESEGLLSKLSASEDRARKAEAKLGEVESKLKELEAAATKFKAAEEKAHAAAESARAAGMAVSELSAKAQAAERRASEVEVETAEQAKQLQEEKGKTKAAETKAKEAGAKAKAAEDKLEKAQEKVAALQEEADESKVQLHDLEARLVHAEAALSEKSEELSTLHKWGADLEGRLQLAEQRRAAEVDVLMREVTALQQQLGGLQHELQRADDIKNQAVADAVASVDDLRQQLASVMTSQREEKKSFREVSLEGEINALKVAAEQSAMWRHRVQELEARLREADAQFHRQATQLRAEEDKVVHHEETISLLQKQIQDFIRGEGELEATIIDVTERVQAAEEQCSLAQKGADEALVRMQEMEAKYKAAEDNGTQWKKENKSLQKIVKDFTDKTKSLETQLQEAKEKAELIKTEVTKATVLEHPTPVPSSGAAAAKKLKKRVAKGTKTPEELELEEVAAAIEASTGKKGKKKRVETSGGYKYAYVLTHAAVAICALAAGAATGCYTNLC